MLNQDLKNTFTEPTNQDISLREVFQFFKRLIKKFWALLLMLPLLFAAFGYAYILTIPNVYEIRTKVLIKSPEKQSNSFEKALQGLYAGEGSSLENEIQIIRSNALLRKTIKSLNLQNAWKVKKEFRTVNAYGSLPFTVDTTSIVDKGFYTHSFLVSLLDSTKYTISTPNFSRECIFGVTCDCGIGQIKLSYNGDSIKHTDYVLNVSDSITTTEKYKRLLKADQLTAGTNIIEMAVTTQSQKEGIDFLGMHINNYLEQVLDENKEITVKTRDFIKERLLLIEGDLEDVEGRIETFKKKRGLALNLSAEIPYQYSRLTENEKKLYELSTQQEILRAYIELLSQGNVKDFLPVNLQAENNEVNSLIRRYNELITERNRLNDIVTESHPSYLQNEQNISNTKIALLKSLNSSKSNVVRELELVEGTISDLKNTIRQAPTTEKELLNVQRRQATKENLYLYLLQKQEENELALTTTSSNIKVIDPAIPVKKPSSPNRRLIFFLSIFAGTLIAFLIAYILTVTDNTFTSYEELKAITPAPILGSIHQSKSKRNIVISKQNRTVDAEVFRGLRTNLNFILPSTDGCKTILVTSSVSGEGKTFTSVNLAVSLALTNKKVIALGFDLRRPKLDTYLEVETGLPGLTNFLAGDSSVNSITHQYDDMETLHFIPSGPVPPNPAELMLTDRMDDLFSYLKEHYDYIVIDTPPILLVADAFLLKKYQDTAIMVVRSKTTTRKMVDSLNKVYSDNRFNNLTVILNGVAIADTEYKGKYYEYYSDSSAY